MEIPKQPWAVSGEEILRALQVDREKGLSAAEVRERRKQYGNNRLREIKARPAWRILLDQFKSLMAILLAAATVLSFVFGDLLEGFAILAVILINAVIGFFTEWRATRSMEALSRLTKVSAKVRRKGEAREIGAHELVPGDIVLLEGGDIVSADLRLVEASKAQADESALTGESVPVGKQVEPLEGEIPLAERKNMLFKGTALTRGSAEGVVVATGMNTELGGISALVEEAEEERTPLEKRLDELARKLIGVTLGIGILIAVTGILAGRDVFLMIETAIALAVAAVPEGLPIVATIALARGMWRMARRNALINRLSAVETLGATNVICTDKTGTLTENRMTVRCFLFDFGPVNVDGKEGSAAAFSREGEEIRPADFPVLREALEIAVLCNNASLGKEEGKEVGDPLEVALLVAGGKGGVRREEMKEKFAEVREEAFDPDEKKMATFHKEDGHYRVAVKGAPESVLEICSRLRSSEGDRGMTPEDRAHWLAENDRMAEQGLRILALAAKRVSAVDSNPYEDLTFLGLVGMSDPPREDVREAISECQKAGLRVVMVTGDQAETARSISQAVGLIGARSPAEIIEGKDLEFLDELPEKEKERFLQASVFARVSPKQKLDLISFYQKNGAVVAMTGDGVNDAPALKKADIGVAMGRRGTQVAREAADMILKDDSFPTIVAAVEEGRVIFANIRKFVLYLLSCNVSEILAVSLASFANAPLPILPLQILFLNLVTDIFPALALGAGEGDPDIMKEKPRDPGEPVLTRRHWWAIGGYGMTITFSVLGSLALAVLWLEMEQAQAVTVSFLTLGFAQLWHVFNMRERGSRFWRNEITKNFYVWGALVLCTGLLILAVYLPGLSRVLKVVSPGCEGWLLVIAMSLIPCGLGQIGKAGGSPARSAEPSAQDLSVSSAERSR